jgi:hypothetical protein
MNTTKLRRYEELLGVKMRLDKFFSMYLDKYGDKMDSDKVDTPVWKLYKVKLKEYDEVSSEIKELEYWLSKTEEKVNKKQLEHVLTVREEALTVEQEKLQKEQGVNADEKPVIDVKSLVESGLKKQEEAGATLEHYDESKTGFTVVFKDGTRKGFRYNTGEEVVDVLKSVDEMDD